MVFTSVPFTPKFQNLSYQLCFHDRIYIHAHVTKCTVFLDKTTPGDCAKCIKYDLHDATL